MLAFAAVSDPLLKTALWVGVAAFAASLAMVAAVFVLRLSLIARNARAREVTERWQPLLAACALQAPASAPALHRRDVPVFLRLWCQAQESLRGEAQANLVELARQAGAPKHVQRLLSGRSARKQLLAVLAAGHLKLGEVAPRLDALIIGPPTLTSLLAAQAIVRIDPERGLPLVIAWAAHRDDWPPARVVTILSEVDPAQVGSYLAAALRAELSSRRPGKAVQRLLRLHQSAYAASIEPVIAEILSRGDSDAEHLIAALGAVWDPLQLPWLRRHAEHPDWPVRAAAARALGRLGSRNDIETLVRMLSDRSWWVRYRAAQSLATLPALGPEDLIAIRRRVKDRYARDMLAQAVADRGVWAA